MYSSNDDMAISVMEHEHIGGEYYPDEYLGKVCKMCGDAVDEEDDGYLYNGQLLCGSCIKKALFDEYGEDYRIRR